MKTLIRNGCIVDGTGNEPYTGDLLIEKGQIAAVGQGMSVQADRVVEAAGKVVTPGFVDIHRHCDVAVLQESDFGQAELAQGITSAVAGPCGLAPVPMRAETAEQLASFIAPCLGRPDRWQPQDLAQYLGVLAAKSLPINLGAMAAVGATRVAVKGFSPAPYTQAEMQAAQGILREALQAGALGVSLGIMYPPEYHTTQAEYVRLLSAAAPFGRPVCCHLRGEGDSVVPSVQEVLEIGERAQVPIHISHFKAVGKVNWQDKIFRAMEAIESARAKGQDVTVDFYPYTAGASTLVSLLPPTVMEGDTSRLWDRLGTPEGVRQVRDAMRTGIAGWEDMTQSIGWDRLIVSSARMPEAGRLLGRSLQELVEILGVEDPVAVLCEVLHQSGGEAGVIMRSMDEADVRTIAQLPYSIVISDALYGEATHPRRYGAFARLLRRYVVEDKVLTLAQAVRKMTSLPAQRMGINGRGRLAEGCMADVAIFDLVTVQDTATYEQPRQLAEGMELVLIGGEVAWQHGRCIERRGSVLLA